MKNRKFKSQVGAISVFVMIAMLFFLVTVIGVYTIVSRRGQAQTESLGLIQDKYCRDGEEIVRYDAKITSSDEKIPVYTKEQFWSIGEARAVEIDGKIYDYSSTDYEKYELKNDIIVNIETDLARSKFKDDLFFSDKIMKNGHEILYYYQGKYYKPIAYSEDGTNETKLAEGEKVLSVSGTNFSTISSKVTGLIGKYYLFGKVVIIPRGLEVGDYVTYEPSGTYNWQAEYASSDLTPVTDDVTLSSATGQSFNIKSWRVLSIDNKTGKVELVPTNQTAGSVRLQGAQGYNNAVYLLNEACSKLYGNEEKGISARSINNEDIENRMTPKALEEVHSYVNERDSDLQYGKQEANAYITKNSKYPTIYSQEKLSVIDGVENTTGLGMSQQNALIGRTDEGAELGLISTATSIQPYQTYYKTTSVFLKEALGDNYNLLVPRDTATDCYIASRCIRGFTGYCGFRLNNLSRRLY